jgi:putative transposase
MRKLSFTNGNIYHLYNRGVDKRVIFCDDHDYFRFSYGLYEFNDEKPAEHIYEPRLSETESRKEFILKEREQIVHIYAFCLMDNHFHLMVKQIKDGGVVKLMHKLGVGYTGFFNKKYGRSGHLFQGKFKAVPMQEESQLLHLPYYIHANPLDIYTPGWREDGIGDYQRAIKIIENYSYSSFSAYTKNFKHPVLDMDFLSELLGNPEEYKNNMVEWLRERSISKLDNFEF